MARTSPSMRAWRRENGPTPPADKDDADAELTDIEAIWRWIRAYLRAGLGQRHQAAPEPDLSDELLARWRQNLDQVVADALRYPAVHGADVERCARWVRETLRHDLGHRPRFRTRPESVTEIQSDLIYGLALDTVVVLGQRRPQRAGGRELLALRIHAQDQQHREERRSERAAREERLRERAAR
jgi:hypothetical protein